MTEFVDQILTIRTVLSQTILCIENSDMFVTIPILWCNLRTMVIPNVHWGQVLIPMWNSKRGSIGQFGLVLYLWEHLVCVEDALEFSMQFSCNPRVRYVRINLCLDQTVSFCSECEVWVLWFAASRSYRESLRYCECRVMAPADSKLSNRYDMETILS